MKADLMRIFDRNLVRLLNSLKPYKRFKSYQDLKAFGALHKNMLIFELKFNYPEND